MGANASTGGVKDKKKNPAVLTEDEINLLLANTSFSREEILKWHEGFIRDCPKGIYIYITVIQPILT